MRACLALAWLIVWSAGVWADGAIVAMQTPAQADISVYEPGQKALIGWNGSCEVLILSTDVSAQEETKALRIVPLPSEPKIGRASFDVFIAVQTAIRRHAPPVVGVDHDGSRGDREREGGAPTVLLHKRIGPHDITVVKASDYGQFLRWANDFAAGLGPEVPKFSEGFESVVTRVLRSGIRYFAFDVTDAPMEVGSIEPLSYQFDTDQLYYPLRISSTVQGHTEVQVFLVSRFRLDLTGNKTPLQPAVHFTSSGEEPVRFSLTRSEIAEISDQMAAVLGGRDGHFAALRYKGPLAALQEDLWLGYEKRPFDPRAREQFLRKGE